MEAFDYNTLLNDTIDAISMRQGFTSDPLEDTNPMSTGLLMLDLVYGGGIRPAWYTHYGREQSCKTTGALSILASAIKQNIPMIAFCDYEGSTKNSLPYVTSIFQTMGVTKTVKQVFGERDKETGEWVTKPIVRYRAETIAEKFFDWLSEILRQLPDKKKVAGKWWLIFEDNKANKAKLGDFADKNMPKKYGPGLWIPAEDDKLQAIILLDSYPAMNPLDNDEQDSNKTIALKARMFSAQIPRVKGRLASKMVAVIGINQLRAAPMAMYGPSEIEPCGEALKYNCFGKNTLLFTEYGLLTAEEYNAMPSHSLLGSYKGLETSKNWHCVGFSNTIRITTQHGYFVTGKPGHKVYVLDYEGQRNRINPHWSTLAQLNNSKTNTSQSPYVAVSYREQEFPSQYQTVDFEFVGNSAQSCQVKRNKLNFVFNEDYAELVGWIISEGCTMHGCAGISNINPHHLDRIEHLCEKLGIHCYRSDVQVSFADSTFVQWLNSIGLSKLSIYKDIPLIVRMSPKSVQAAFLKGLFMGDETSGRSLYTYASTSNVLLDQLQVMLLSFGIYSKKNPYKRNYREHKLINAEQELLSSANVLLSKELNIQFSKKFKGGSIDITSSDAEKLSSIIDWKTYNITSVNESGSNKFILPELFTPTQYAEKPKFVRWFIDNIKKKNKYWRTTQFYDSWFSDFTEYALSLRTKHEREFWIKEGTRIKDLIDFTKSNNIVWQKIESITADEYQQCYDATQVDTHTIITNGIVSHNSDCRCKFTPRSSGMPFSPTFDAESKLEIEPSVTGEGQDKYRYIAIHATKNKLWTPNRKGWIRLWAEDNEGQGKGFDPVFDTACYLYYTGQLAYRGRKTMKLRFVHSSKEEPKIIPIKWDQIKRWVLGDREVMKQVCSELGIEKPFSLRRECFKQLENGLGEKLYINTSQKKNASTDSEDEE